MSTTAASPRLHPPQSLNEQLVRLSHYCNIAVADGSPQAVLLASSVRKQVITPLRHQICQARISNQLDEQLETVATLQGLFETFLTHEKTPPLSKLYHALNDAIAPLGLCHTRDILTAIWHDLHDLLAPHLTEWIYRGLIHDSSSFFISSDPDNTFTIDHNNLPPFISHKAAQAILETGIARRTSAALAPENQCTIVSITLPPPCTTISIDAASSQWRHEAVNHLSQVLPFDQLRAKLIIIRDHLLQGDGLFWRSFFDQLRRYDLQLRANTVDDNARVERALNAVLTALSDGDPPFVFILRDGVLPSVPLSFVEQQLFQERCHIYTDLFSITFNARRSSENSRHAFVHLNALHREIRSFDTGLIELMKLRREIECVVHAIENYIHLGVLGPGFSKVLHALSSDVSDNMERLEKAKFDTIAKVHNSFLNTIVAKCFLRERQIRARLTAIFGLSLEFSTLIVSTNSDKLREQSMYEDINSFSKEFERNVGLLFQLLSRTQLENPDGNLSVLVSSLESVCERGKRS